MNSAIILAGGIGSRMKKDIPKQFILIKNKMIIDYSVKAFLKNKKINEVIIVCAKEWIDKLRNQYPALKIVVGGESRTISSFHGLKACNEKTENVLIHDAARPMISQKIINDCIDCLKNNDAAIPEVYCSDSVFDIASMNYIDRENIRLIQTPQGFKLGRMHLAFNFFFKKSDREFSDDFSLFNFHIPSSRYAFFKGSKKNIKITTPDDLIVIKNYLNE